MSPDDDRGAPPVSLYRAFLKTAEQHSDALAWIDTIGGDPLGRWSWSEVRERVQSAAAWLHDRGVVQGDRIANTEKNSFDWAILDLACAAIGAIHAPIDPRLPQAMQSDCLMQLEPRLIFASEGATSLVEEFRGRCAGSTLVLRTSRLRPSSAMEREWQRRENDANVACILFTSGTSNRPRGVMLTHRNLLSNAAAKLEAMPQRADDIRLNLLPFAHAYARTCELTAWILAGGCMVTAQGVQNALRLAPQVAPTLINAVPSWYENLHHASLASAGDQNPITQSLGKNLRRLASGGAPLADGVRAFFDSHGFPIYQGYGLTEASPVVCSNREPTATQPAKQEWVGPPVAGVRLRIDEERRIWVQGSGVMQGYWRDPNGTQARLSGGWLDTGDLADPRCLKLAVAGGWDTRAEWHAEHGLSIEGRQDDVQILSSGYKFSPGPIERRILQCPWIQSCVLLGNHRRKPLLVVRLVPSETDQDPIRLLGAVRDLLHDMPEYAKPTRLWIDPDPWTQASGRLHWKGGVDRKRFEREMSDRV